MPIRGLLVRPLHHPLSEHLPSCVPTNLREMLSEWGEAVDVLDVPEDEVRLQYRLLNRSGSRLKPQSATQGVDDGDTTLEQVERGKDYQACTFSAWSPAEISFVEPLLTCARITQGIPWENLPWTRENYRVRQPVCGLGVRSELDISKKRRGPERSAAALVGRMIVFRCTGTMLIVPRARRSSDSWRRKALRRRRCESWSKFLTLRPSSSGAQLLCRVATVHRASLPLLQDSHLRIFRLVSALSIAHDNASHLRPFFPEMAAQSRVCRPVVSCGLSPVTTAGKQVLRVQTQYEERSEHHRPLPAPKSHLGDVQAR